MLAWEVSVLVKHQAPAMPYRLRTSSLAASTMAHQSLLRVPITCSLPPGVRGQRLPPGLSLLQLAADVETMYFAARSLLPRASQRMRWIPSRYPASANAFRSETVSLTSSLSHKPVAWEIIEKSAPKLATTRRTSVTV